VNENELLVSALCRVLISCVFHSSARPFLFIDRMMKYLVTLFGDVIGENVVTKCRLIDRYSPLSFSGICLSSVCLPLL